MQTLAKHFGLVVVGP